MYTDLVYYILLLCLNLLSVHRMSKINDFLFQLLYLLLTYLRQCLFDRNPFLVESQLVRSMVLTHFQSTMIFLSMSFWSLFLTIECRWNKVLYCLRNLFHRFNIMKFHSFSIFIYNCQYFVSTFCLSSTEGLGS